MKATVVKNRFFSPHKEGFFDILFDSGIDKIGSLFDLAMEHNIITRSGAFYKFMDNRIGNSRDRGREKALRALRNNADLIELIKVKLTESI